MTARYGAYKNRDCLLRLSLSQWCATYKRRAVSKQALSTGRPEESKVNEARLHPLTMSIAYKYANSVHLLIFSSTAATPYPSLKRGAMAPVFSHLLAFLAIATTVQQTVSAVPLGNHRRRAADLPPYVLTYGRLL